MYIYIYIYIWAPISPLLTSLLTCLVSNVLKLGVGLEGRLDVLLDLLNDFFAFIACPGASKPGLVPNSNRPTQQFLSSETAYAYETMLIQNNIKQIYKWCRRRRLKALGTFKGPLYVCDYKCIYIYIYIYVYIYQYKYRLYNISSLGNNDNTK